MLWRQEVRDRDVSLGKQNKLPRVHDKPAQRTEQIVAVMNAVLDIIEMRERQMTAAAVLEGVGKKRQVVWRLRHGGVAAPGRLQDLADQAVPGYRTRVSEIDDGDLLEPRLRELIESTAASPRSGF